MTESEKKSIILKYVSDNPNIDESVLPRVAIPFVGNSTKYGGQYIRYYLPDTGMQYINEIPGSEVSEAKPLFMASKPKTNSYDKYIHYLYVKHIPEYDMCEFKLMYLQANAVDRKKLVDERKYLMHPVSGWESGYFKSRFFIFKDDCKVYSEDGSEQYTKYQKKYYNKELISALRYVINIQSNELSNTGITSPDTKGIVNYWTSKTAELPSVIEFKKFISTCKNGTNPECEFSTPYYFSDVYKKYCYPRDISSKTIADIDKSNPYESYNSLLKDIDEINNECMITYTYTGRSTWGSYMTRCEPDSITNYRMNSFGYVEKITDKLFIMRVFETDCNYASELCKEGKLKEGISTKVKNNVYERNRFYFNIENGKMNNYLYNSYSKKHVLTTYNDVMWTDCIMHEDVLIDSGYLSDMCKDFIKRINDKTSSSKVSGHDCYIRDKIAIIYKANKYPIYETLYNNGMEDFSYNMITIRRMPSELFNMPDTKSKDIKKNFGMSSDVLRAYINIMRDYSDKTGNTLNIIVLTETIKILNDIFTEDDILSPDVQNHIINFFVNVMNISKHGFNGIYPYSNQEQKYNPYIKSMILKCDPSVYSEQKRRVEAIISTYPIWRNDFEVDYPWYTADIDAVEAFSNDLLAAYRANDVTLIPSFTPIP